MQIRRVQAVVVAALFSTLAASESACFYPDGKNATGLSPCKLNSDVSHCCRDGDLCLTNGLCFSSGLGSVVRRGCTDQTWKSKDCPNICNIDVFRSSDAVLTPCGTYNNFCCGQDEAARNCCNNGNATLAVQVGAGDIVPTETSPSTSSTSGSNPTTSPTSSTTPSAASNSCPASSSKTERNALLGVAIAFGVIMLGAIALAMFWRRGMKKQEEMKLVKEKERQKLEVERKALDQEKQWLERAMPPAVLRELQNRRANAGSGA